MYSSALVVIIGGTILFFAFAIWMAFYSRRHENSEEQTKLD